MCGPYGVPVYKLQYFLSSVGINITVYSTSNTYVPDVCLQFVNFQIYECYSYCNLMYDGIVAFDVAKVDLHRNFVIYCISLS